MEHQLEELRLEFTNGSSPSELVSSMSRRGYSILSAIKATRELLGITLGEAKDLVASHAAYRSIAEVSVPLQDEIIRSLEGLSNETSAK